MIKYFVEMCVLNHINVIPFVHEVRKSCECKKKADVTSMSGEAKIMNRRKDNEIVIEQMFSGSGKINKITKQKKTFLQYYLQ